MKAIKIHTYNDDRDVIIPIKDIKEVSRVGKGVTIHYGDKNIIITYERARFAREAAQDILDDINTTPKKARIRRAIWAGILIGASAPCLFKEEVTGDLLGLSLLVSIYGLVVFIKNVIGNE